VVVWILCNHHFAGIYLYRYHVAKTAPLSKEELAISLEQAAADKEEYLKNLLIK